MGGMTGGSMALLRAGIVVAGAAVAGGLFGPLSAVGNNGAATGSDGVYSIAIHGGAGVLKKSLLPPGRAEEFRIGVCEALSAAESVILETSPLVDEEEGTQGSIALQAAVAAVKYLEDSPIFNAGRGAVLDVTGGVSHDASLMDGRDGECGAVAAMGPNHHGKLVRNPILAALAVKNHPKHIMLDGHAGRKVAEVGGLAFEPEEWFITEERKKALETAIRVKGVHLDHGSAQGTVGCVVMANGNLAAATSTGGMTAKLPGRIGDSAVIGAGTWASDVVAVSATGHGEKFIQLHVASRVADLMELAGMDLVSAADKVVHEELVAIKGSGGLIAVDSQGTLALPYNSGGMIRGAIHTDGRIEVAIWDEVFVSC